MSPHEHTTFPPRIIDRLQKEKIFAVSAGMKRHRFIGVWMVVVENNVFVRSWGLAPDGWYRTFLKEPRGRIQLGTRRIAVRAVHTRSERLKSAVDKAYRKKYNTPGALAYVRGFKRPRRRNTTLQILPGK